LIDTSGAAGQSGQSRRNPKKISSEQSNCRQTLPKEKGREPLPWHAKRKEEGKARPNAPKANKSRYLPVNLKEGGEGGPANEPTKKTIKRGLKGEGLPMTPEKTASIDKSRDSDAQPQIWSQRGELGSGDEGPYKKLAQKNSQRENRKRGDFDRQRDP